MSQTTKHALEASLKNLLAQKPLDKITISDIADDCGINRMLSPCSRQDTGERVPSAGRRMSTTAYAPGSFASLYPPPLPRTPTTRPSLLNVAMMLSRYFLKSPAGRQCLSAGCIVLFHGFAQGRSSRAAHTAPWLKSAYSVPLSRGAIAPALCHLWQAPAAQRQAVFGKKGPHRFHGVGGYPALLRQGRRTPAAAI